MLESLRDLLIVQCRSFLQKLDEAVREDVYALSLYTDAGDTIEPELVLSFNTGAQITRTLADQTGSQWLGPPSNETEARWNYAFWLDAPTESRIIYCQSRQREDCFQKAVIKRGLRRIRRSALRARSSSSQ